MRSTTPAPRRSTAGGAGGALVLCAALSSCGGSTNAPLAVKVPTTSTLPASSSPTASTPAVPAVPSAPGPWDWPSYGHDAQHSFSGRTTLTPAAVKTLSAAWFFPTGDAVTATPTV